MLSPDTAVSEYTFKSSKKSVASVDGNGLVTAHKKGTAKITVTSKKSKKAKATITIKVNKPPKASKDLSTYMGTSIKTAATKLGFKNEGKFGDDGDAFFRISKGGALMEAGGDKYETALVDSLDIFSKSDYNFAGVTYGMKRADAQAKLKAGGWNLVEESEQFARYQKNNVVVEIECYSTVSYIYAHLKK